MKVTINSLPPKIRSIPGKFLFCVIIFTVIVSTVTNQPAFGFTEIHKNDSQILKNHVSLNSLKTVLLRNAAWEMADPVIEQGSEKGLELIFDDLSMESRYFTYTLVHCDASWRRSDLEPQEYLTGMGEESLDDPEPSRNTTIDYLHYQLLFPTENCMPVLSGNYALLVFERDNEEPVIIRRFSITAKEVDPVVQILQAPAGEFRETGQQVQVTIDHSGIRLREAGNELIVVVRQNGRDDNCILLHPSFNSPGKIEYKQPDSGIFPGGNEYRTLDIRNMRYQTQNIAEIDYLDKAYRVNLKTDESRAYKPYFNKTDLNGNFRVELEKSDFRHLEADYVYVQFELSQPFPFEEEVYVFGALTDWTMTDLNRMTYSIEKQQYTATILLKQGYYDYGYTLGRPGGLSKEEEIEGSFYETGNAYDVLIYQHDRYDRLIGYKAIK